MSVLVFATYDVTPEEWADFTKRAAMPEVNLSPYILVSSRTHKGFEDETKEIEAPVESEFKTATYGEIKDLFTTIVDSNDRDVETKYFLLLDQESPKERKVVLTQKIVLHLNPGGGFLSLKDEENANKIEVQWRRHRLPYEKTGLYVALLTAHGGVEDEPYLEEEKTERIDVEES